MDFIFAKESFSFNLKYEKNLFVRWKLYAGSTQAIFSLLHVYFMSTFILEQRFFLQLFCIVLWNTL